MVMMYHSKHACEDMERNSYILSILHQTFKTATATEVIRTSNDNKRQNYEIINDSSTHITYNAYFIYISSEVGSVTYK